MEVYALVGPTGTGKSHRAIVVAHQYDAELIIDDGLLIKDGTIMGGSSAKHQSTRIGAIRSSLFASEKQLEEAKAILSKVNPSRILILGTSTAMAEKIANRLGLPPFKKVILIEELASSKEIRKAKFMRLEHSKHVIPAPIIEVKKTFPGTLINPLRVFLHKKEPSGKKNWLEQSIIRPTSTLYGSLSITDHTLNSIITKVTEEIEGVAVAGKINITQNKTYLIIEITPTLIYGFHLKHVSQKIQAQVKSCIQDLTGLTVSAVNIFVNTLTFPKGFYFR